MLSKQQYETHDDKTPVTMPLALFACPNSDCADFNTFDADNLSVAEWMGKDKAIRRLYCKIKPGGCGGSVASPSGAGLPLASFCVRLKVVPLKVYLRAT